MPGEQNHKEVIKMSHFSRVQTKFQDKEMLVHCLKEMGYQVELGGNIWGYEGKRNVEVAARKTRGCDIGFVLNAQGFYEMIADWWGVSGGTAEKELMTSQLEEHFERIQSQIRREYALRTVLEKTRAQGFDVVEQGQQPDGTIRIVVRRWV
jgi:hypothetical protein